MTWDKIKLSVPVNRGNDAHGESASVRPPDNPGSSENPAEGLTRSARGRRGRGDGPDHANRGRGNRVEAHPRVQDVLNEGKQRLEKLFGRVGDAHGEHDRTGRGDDHGPPGHARKDRDAGPTGRDTGPLRTRHSDEGEHGPRRDSLPKENARQANFDGDNTRHAGRDTGPLRHPSEAGREHGRSHESHGHDHDNQGRRTHGSGHDHDGRRTQGFGQDNDGPGESFLRAASPNAGRDGGRGVSGDSHGRGHGLLDTHGHSGDGRRGGIGVDVPTLVSYLRGDASGAASIPPDLRRALDGASRVLGPDFLKSLEARASSFDGEKAVRFVEHALERVARTLERVTERGGAAATGTAPRVFDEAVGELLAATLLDKYFRQAEKTGGRVVAQAEAALARLLYGGERSDDDGSRLRAPGGFELPSPRTRELQPAPHPLEVLRDLHAGAFRPAEVGRSPFPLSGRALIATEMMEMMRTLDAVDRVTRELLTAARAGNASAATPAFVAGDGEEAPALALLRALAGTAAGAELLDELLGALSPTLPGRAARQEIPRLVAALGGVLVDADGRTFVAKDGAGLKLDQLLWLGTLGGVLKSVAAGESFPVRLSPLLIYGFDAVYSLIGFDGRTLNPPHFAAVQAQVNGSEMEWVFGQPPLSEGWMRALIERLKDSAQADHNLLGEMLEEALADGRFHAALVGGTVTEGEAVADTFAVTRLLPGATAAAAFSPA